MRVLLIANTTDEETGHVGERLVEHGATFTTARRDSPGGPGTLPSGIDLVLLLGSAWSVYDPAHRTEVAAEIALVRSAEAAGIAVLGICFGAQLLAAAGGGVVSPAPVPEVGFATLTTSDPELAPPGPWFQLHQDQWSSSPALPEMARTELGPQAFRRGRSLAWQFHPEVTVATAIRWLEEDRHLVEKAGVDPEELRAEIVTREPASVLGCSMLVDAFVEQVMGDVTPGPRHPGGGGGSGSTSARMAP